VDDDALLKDSDTRCARHKEEQRGEKQARDEDDAADLELRPPNLSLTGQANLPRDLGPIVTA
jgi:hypothetical protein